MRTVHSAAMCTRRTEPSHIECASRKSVHTVETRYSNFHSTIGRGGARTRRQKRGGKEHIRFGGCELKRGEPGRGRELRLCGVSFSPSPWVLVWRDTAGFRFSITVIFGVKIRITIAVTLAFAVTVAVEVVDQGSVGDGRIVYGDVVDAGGPTEWG